MDEVDISALELVRNSRDAWKSRALDASDEINRLREKMIRLENMVGAQMSYSALRSQMLDVLNE